MRPGRILRQLVYPDGAVCQLCGSVSHGDLLCGYCRRQLGLMRLAEPLCPRCGAPTVPGKDCGCRLPEYLTVRSAYLYAGPAAQLVQRLKFSQVGAAHVLLAQGITESLSQLDLPEDTVVTWITMPASRWKERAFDHAQLLAQAAAEQLGLPCRKLLERP